ncbi:MAG: ribosomal protein S18-alanine N-acetyltransferase [Acidimicrobiales bacterium]
MSIRFVEMTASHVEPVAALEAAVSTAPWSRGLFADELTLDASERFWLVAVDGAGDADGSVVGFGGLMFVGEDAHLMNIAVAPTVRRRGIGRRLFDALAQAAMDRGCVHLTLEVRVSNSSAIALYEDRGMHSVGVRPGYYEDGEDASIMWWYDMALANEVTT